MTRYAMTLMTVGLLLGTTAAWAEDGYLSFKQATAERVSSKDGGQRVTVRLESHGEVPMDGKSGAFGYAALSDNANNVLVLVTHLPIDDSSHEAADSGFHAHVLDLKAPTSACAGASFEVDVENSKKNPAFDAAYTWNIRGRHIEIKDIPATDLGDAGIEGFAAFKLKPVLGADGKPTHLCVTVVDQA